MRRAALLAAAVLAAAAPAVAATRITEPGARAFVASQEALWNAGRFNRYFAGFTRDATFTDQAYVGGKPPVPYGASTLAEARAQVAKSHARTQERGEVRSVRIAPDGASAEVASIVGSTVTADGRTRRLCASRAQSLVLDHGALKVRRQVDTYVHCRNP